MKYPFLALLCAAQLLQGPVVWAKGETSDIVKYTRYDNLRISGHLFYTAELQRLYGERGYRSLWFSRNQANGNLNIYLSFIGQVRNAGPENQSVWIPMARQFVRTADNATWVTLELVATHSLLIYLNSRGIYDYYELNAALEGGSDDFAYYLRNLSLPEYAPPGAGAPLNLNPDIIQVQPLDPVQPNQPRQTMPSVQQPVDQGTPSQIVQTAIGTSNARYANDPTNDDINQFYQAHNSAVWVDTYGRANEKATALRDVLRNAGRHGLNPDDYWDVNLENLYQNAQRGNGMSFESAATYALIRYVKHLSNGRLDPQQVDAKLFKFQKQNFTDYQYLGLMMDGRADQLKASLDSLAPQVPEYKQLMNTMVLLQKIKAQGTWLKIGQPKNELKMGDSSPVIGYVRRQLAQLGYQNAGSGNVYDQSYDQLIQTYLAKNGLPEKVDYRFWNSLYVSVDDRINQVAVNMEKLRWIPAQSSNHFAFVNLAAHEITLFDDGQVKMKFKTVNGMATRPTPSMLQQARRVILNPTWTVPPTLAMKDKLPIIRQNPNYMTEHNMYVLDARKSQYITDITQVDLNAFTDNNNTPYYLVQGPGNQNALGVLKFPLQNMDGSLNSDDIYMHDTNERELFGETNRYRSSGCIRLQYPLEFAAELLKDKMSIDDIKAQVPWGDPNRQVAVNETNKSVSLSKPLIVYVMYLTSEQNEDGSVRMFEDTYGLDAKILAALKASI